MSEHPPARRIRASDADRDAVLQILQTAHAAGRLDVVELGERQDAALQARFTDELPLLVDDLPEGATYRGSSTASPAVRPSAMPPVGVAEGPTSVTFMTGKDVQVPPGTAFYRNFAWWGGDNIHLGDVMGPGVVVTLELHAIMAGHDIYVPEGVRVLDETIAIMAGNDIRKEARGDGSNGTLILKGFLFWAGNDVQLEERSSRR